MKILDPAYQWLADAETVRGDGRLMRIRRRLRRLVTRFGDPAVTYSHHGFKLSLPLSHDLPRYVRNHSAYDEYLGEVVQKATAQGIRIRAIDVGANVGDTAAIILSAGADSVLCVEGDPTYLKYLSDNIRLFAEKEVDLAPVFLGDSDETVVAHRARGTASLVVSPNGVKTVSFENLLRTHPEFRAANLLKIDTDGWEVRILRSASAWLSSQKPLLVVEYDPERLHKNGFSTAELWTILDECGYTQATVFTNLGLHVFSSSLAGARDYLASPSTCADYWDLVLSSRFEEEVVISAAEVTASTSRR